jgi:cytochrome P450
MELNPFAPEFQADPWPVYRHLREHAPLYRNERLDFWALSRFADVLSASQDWATYSSAEGTLLERLDPAFLEATPMMIFLDPPRHDRLRRLVQRAFTPRRLAALEPFVRATAAAGLDGLVARGGGDVVADLAALLPMEVIFTLLGVPADDRRPLRRWIDDSLDRTPEGGFPDHALTAMANLLQYWFRFLPRVRARPDEGLVSALCAADIDGEALTDGEIVGFCQLLGAAGNETVTKLLANTVVLLHRHPEAWAACRADPGRIPNAVEEALRWTSPSQYQGRVTTRDVSWYGRTVPRGARILLLTAAANRDDRQFPDPDRFDVGREIPVALGFGHGVHFCLGAALARLEMRVALEEMARRMPRFTVDEAGCRRVHGSNVHGWSSVPVRVG